ncbi:MAG: hypothetical protein GEV28_27585 [Actinophytocola sp.]|uniref:hypothetical protein n=1 Tax=Actinophytocola sp. TaxID=1872138 RepID=UPI00132AC0DD|nr:hypothetical protein [Actinophytocola sp.]MPZ83951.1 hypothetical protein [Actinophytocola sp.]
MHQHIRPHEDNWLTSVVNHAALLATEMAQLTDYLAAQRDGDSAAVIGAHAQALKQRLRQLDAAADEPEVA